MKWVFCKCLSDFVQWIENFIFLSHILYFDALTIQYRGLEAGKTTVMA